MTRINVMSRPALDDYADDSGPQLLGWFDSDRATRYGEDTRWDGSNHVSINTGSQWDHEALYRTASGRWVLTRWSQRQGSVPAYEFVEPERARDWLLLNGEDEAVAEHFGLVEEERGPGRPEIGPAINLRLPPDLLARLDAAAEADGITRAEKVRRVLAAALPPG